MVKLKIQYSIQAVKVTCSLLVEVISQAESKTSTAVIGKLMIHKHIFQMIPLVKLTNTFRVFSKKAVFAGQRIEIDITAVMETANETSLRPHLISIATSSNPGEIFYFKMCVLRTADSDKERFTS